MREFLILTVSDAKNDIFTLIDAGADGYLLKDTEPDVLLEQIKRIAQGEVILSDSIKNLLLERKHTVDPMDSLTDREMDVLRLIATGLSNKQIAGQLFILKKRLKYIFVTYFVNLTFTHALQQPSCSLSEMVDRQVSKHKKVQLKLTALFYFF